MECKDIRIWLSAYLDGELDAGKKAMVEEHLGNCPDCRNSLEELRDYLELVKKPEKKKAPEGLGEAIWDELKKEEQPPVMFLQNVLRNRWFQAVSGLAAALLILAYLLMEPNLLNTRYFESDFAFKDTKSGKAPPEKAGSIENEDQSIALIKNIAAESGATISRYGKNEHSGETDFVTLVIRRRNYQDFIRLLEKNKLDIALPGMLKWNVGFISMNLYFPGRKFFTGDFNGDGETDLGCYFWRGKNAGEWYIAFHDEGAYFIPPFKCQVGDSLVSLPYFSSPISGDINGDGFSDILLPLPHDRWKFFISDSNARFIEIEPLPGDLHFPEKDGLYAFMCGDLDHNGFDDIMANCLKGAHAGKWFVAMNQGGTIFSAFSELVIESQASGRNDRYFPFVLDFNGDGYTDCGIYWQDGDLTAKWFISLNDCSGHFQEPFQVFFGSSPLAFWGDYLPFTGDFDGDGYGDLLVKSGTQDETGDWYLMKNQQGNRFTKGFGVKFGDDTYFQPGN